MREGKGGRAVKETKSRYVMRVRLQKLIGEIVGWIAISLCFCYLLKSLVVDVVSGLSEYHKYDKIKGWKAVYIVNDGVRIFEADSVDQDLIGSGFEWRSGDSSGYVANGSYKFEVRTVR
jgi:hypothetical protein